MCTRKAKNAAPDVLIFGQISPFPITTAHARRSGRSSKLEINKPSTSKLVRSLDEKLTVCLSPILNSALIFAHNNRKGAYTNRTVIDGKIVVSSAHDGTSQPVCTHC